MFKNVTVYKIADEWRGNSTTIEQAIRGDLFVPCEPTQAVSMGWVEPRGIAYGALVEVIDGHWLLKFMIEKKSVPASVVKRVVNEKKAQIEEQEGRRPGRKEIKELKEQAIFELLPQAFAKQSAAFVWIDIKKRRLIVDTATMSLADEIIGRLIQSISEFAVAPLHTKTSPAAAMSTWLLETSSPDNFEMGGECELKASDESKAVVRYARHRLDIAEIQGHIREGKVPTMLSMTWLDRVSVTLNGLMQLRKIRFLDVFAESSDEERGGEENTATDNGPDDFDAQVALTTGELSELIGHLVDALGGELAPEDLLQAA